MIEPQYPSQQRDLKLIESQVSVEINIEGLSESVFPSSSESDSSSGSESALDSLSGSDSNLGSDFQSDTCRATSSGLEPNAESDQFMSGEANSVSVSRAGMTPESTAPKSMASKSNGSTETMGSLSAIGSMNPVGSVNPISENSSTNAFAVSEDLIVHPDGILEGQLALDFDLDMASSYLRESGAEPVEGAEIEDAMLIDEIRCIPPKMAFKIGEVAEILKVKAYVLRYWESEFDILKPKKSRFNQRMYTRKDVENALMIKKLLYRDRFSIEGARKALRDLKKKVKEEKTLESVVMKVDSAQNAGQELLTKIRHLKSLFS